MKCGHTRDGWVCTRDDGHLGRHGDMPVDTIPHIMFSRDGAEFQLFWDVVHWVQAR